MRSAALVGGANLSMEVTRRDFIRFCGGAAGFAVSSVLSCGSPEMALAVVGIDDAALGGLVLLVATLGGYAFSRSVANVSLDALGYSFSDFVSDVNNQSAAVTQAIADANNLGVELNRSNAEQAAASIAAGTGYFADVMGDAAIGGRVALDNFISGAGELPGVLRNLVSSFVRSRLSADGASLLSGATGVMSLVPNGFAFDSLLADNAGNLYVSDVSAMDVGLTGMDVAAWVIRADVYYGTTYVNSRLVWGAIPIVLVANNGGRSLTVARYGNASVDIYYSTSNASGVFSTVYTTGAITLGSGSSSYWVNYTFSGSLVNGVALPVVDRAADAPDVIGPGYDSIPLGNDLVIDPDTGEVTSAGTLPLPSYIPDALGDYVGTLNDMLAGVVPGVISLPVSIAEPVVVGTGQGVASMSIADAVSTATSLGGEVPPSPPPGTIDPPVDVPEGPWTPAVSLPFEQLWPFNMIYTVIRVFDELGGS